MNVWIARDGEYIGEFPRDELDARAQAGEFQTTDHYWYEGMEDWRQLDELLGPRVWIPAPTPPPVQPHPLERFGGAKVIPIALGGAAAIYLIIWGTATFWNSRTETVAPQAPAFTPFPNETQLRDKAVADMNARFLRLPAAPAPPTHNYYFDVRAKLTKSASPLAIWSAVITGFENVVDPATQQTRFHTAFTLTADYRSGEWVFKEYHASTKQMDTGATVESDAFENTNAPPSLAAMLGLKMASDFPTANNIGWH